MPRRPRVARNSYGSIFQTTLAENSLPKRVAENEAKARLNKPRGWLGSTYFSCAGMDRFSHVSAGAGILRAKKIFQNDLALIDTP